MIHHGDCVEVMATMPENSVDAIVTDPPYGLGFMSKQWDRDHQHEPWARGALRVAKPGAYLLAFGGTRTFHRLACAIEDAGWIIRDTLVWGYASGFPKGRANLKPAWEPIVMARKPGPLRPLAIDACRIPTDGEEVHAPQSDPTKRTGAVQVFGESTLTQAERFQQAQRESIERTNTLGRWPANIVLTDPIFDGGWEGVVGGGEAGGAAFRPPSARPRNNGIGLGASDERHGLSDAPDQYGDTGTYSRFFLIPKADRADREPNDYGKLVAPLEARRETAHRRTGPMDTPFLRGETMRLNPHPTVKPTELMRHLVRLVTPVGGVVLDPFLGSGTTALAAEQEGFAWIGIEKEAEYVRIAEARLAGVQRGLGLTA